MDYLKDQELLKQIRSRPGRSLWEPAAGLISQMRRAMDVASGDPNAFTLAADGEEVEYAGEGEYTVDVEGEGEMEVAEEVEADE